MFRDLTSVVRRNASLPLAHALVRPQLGDRWIVSYPRSGSTWLRTILAALIYGEGGADPDVFNRVIPGVSGRRLPLVWLAPEPRLLHSHTTFRNGLSRVVYLVRDGRDAITSFYHYSTTRRGQPMDFAAWYQLYSRRAYGPRWHEHVYGWLTAGRDRLGDQLLVVNFERLRSDPLSTVRQVASFLEVSRDDMAIERALDMAGLDRARTREARALGRPLTDNESFYRGGRIGQWEGTFPPSTYMDFMNRARQAMTLAGYAM